MRVTEVGISSVGVSRLTTFCRQLAHFIICYQREQPRLSNLKPHTWVAPGLSQGRTWLGLQSVTCPMPRAPLDRVYPDGAPTELEGYE